MGMTAGMALAARCTGPEPMSAHPAKTISSLAYAICAPLLVFSQNALSASAHHWLGVRIVLDVQFWLLPLRGLAALPGLSPMAAAAAFSFSLAIAWALAILSFRRAPQSGPGYALAAFSIVPAIQIAVVLILMCMPVRALRQLDQQEKASGINVAHVAQGTLAGVTIIVLAVVISAVSFGAYGWGLFVMTPFMAAMTTAYLANRETALPPGRTATVVAAAAALGTLALIMFALEGLVCVLLATPLGALAAAVGGAIGKGLAGVGHRRGRPLLGVAFLPAVFALEAGVPPSVAIDMQQSMVIAAPPAVVWDAATSNEPLGPPPFLVAQAGFAFPLKGRLLGQGVGAERLGIFSTGVAREKVTQWVPGRRLAFVMLSQPPMMEEMSPYRRVHAPHVIGYFETSTTRFELEPLGAGQTRLTIRAGHVLRLDPALYWEPMARWAISSNVARVLQSVKARAEAAPGP